MGVVVGIDVAKEIHWAEIKIAESRRVVSSRRVDNIPDDISALISEIRSIEAEHGTARVGIDILGGIAALLQAMLLEAGLVVVHVPGLAVNRSRRGTTGGEHKSDPKDAKVIADQVRIRDDLRQVAIMTDEDIELRLLAVRRAELVEDAGRRANRLRELLNSIHPGLERHIEVTGKTWLHLLTRYVQCIREPIASSVSSSVDGSVWDTRIRFIALASVTRGLGDPTRPIRAMRCSADD